MEKKNELGRTWRRKKEGYRKCGKKEEIKEVQKEVGEKRDNIRKK